MFGSSNLFNIIERLARRKLAVTLHDLRIRTNKKDFKENFLNANVLVNTFHNSLDKVKANILKKYPEVIGIQIYGEFFGGFWPGKV